MQCVQRYCNGRPPVSEPPLTATFRPNPNIPGTTPDDPEEDCQLECREMYAAGEIDYMTLQACLQDCCIAEKVVEGHSLDMARRLCVPSNRPSPTPRPSCEQRCRGRYGVGTKGYYDCVRRECTITSTFALSPVPDPYIP